MGAYEHLRGLRLALLDRPTTQLGLLQLVRVKPLIRLGRAGLHGLPPDGR